MEVDVEIRPLQWHGNQGSLYCGQDWILAYKIDDRYTPIQAECCFVDCYNLNLKHGINIHGGFDTVEEAQKA